MRTICFSLQSKSNICLTDWLSVTFFLCKVNPHSLELVFYHLRMVKNVNEGGLSQTQKYPNYYVTKS